MDQFVPYIPKAVAIALALGGPLSVVPFMVYLERKICAWAQNRTGPNRVGILGPNGIVDSVLGVKISGKNIGFGLLQPLADAVKLITKEEFIPKRADKYLFNLAPFFAVIPPFIAMAVMPLGADLTIPWIKDAKGYDLTIQMQVADLNVGILWILSVMSLGAYGVALGGWASNNKYSLLGGLRATAQMISYEIGMGITLLSAVMMYQTVSLREMVIAQSGSFWDWGIFQSPVAWLAFITFWICTFAENNRLPFDLPECEAELVGGYHTEFNSMKFGVFFQGEYVAMIMMAALLSVLFLGGWHYPGYASLNQTYPIVASVLSLVVMAGKIGFFVLFSIVVRWTLPRFRYDQLMNLGWKVVIPVALFCLLVNAAWYTSPYMFK